MVLYVYEVLQNVPKGTINDKQELVQIINGHQTDEKQLC